MEQLCATMWLDLFGSGNLSKAYDFWVKRFDFYSNLKVR